MISLPIPLEGEVLIYENELASIFADRTTGYKFDFATVAEKALRTLRLNVHIKMVSKGGASPETVTATIKIGSDIYLIVFTVGVSSDDKVRLSYVLNPEPIELRDTMISNSSGSDPDLGKDLG